MIISIERPAKWRWLLYLAALVVPLAWLVYVLDPTNLSSSHRAASALPKQSVSESMRYEKAPIVDRDRSSSRQQATLVSPVGVGTASMRKTFTLADLDAKKPIPDEMAVLSRFDAWKAKAVAGDTSAMIGIYRTLSGCKSFEPTSQTLPDGTISMESTRCGDVPPDDRVSPFSWLRKAADAGDPRAMLEYGLNAKHIRAANDEERQILNKAAMELLERSASLGLRESVLSLYEAYRSGWYGAPDPVRAIGYLLAAHQLDPVSIDTRLVARQLDTLRQDDRRVATQQSEQILAAMPAR